MCGRYAASADLSELVEEFDVDVDLHEEPARSLLKTPQHPPAGTPDWNMAPTKAAPVVLSRRERDTAEITRQLRLLSWGLVPSWAKGPGAGARMINARADTVATKPAFSKALAARRALIPAQGWYEWQASPTATDAKGKPRKQPFFIHRADGADLAMAGLYEFWRDKAIADSEDQQAWLVTFTILTTSAEPGLDRIHDRQPLVLERPDWARWLDPELTDPTAVADLLAYADPGRFVAYPVSRAVSSNRNNGPHLLDPAPSADLVGVVDPMTVEVIN
ncbi:MAG: SOS response-associated peptidase [Tetrasphaera sp.]